ncbi:hypothetical protein P9222_06035 [Paenibacillus amylolyticus]|nr:hypothetical protein [Paenibacillus amylolyticus]WFR63815.1 hypothetical protein P9222_06035 [Paenibacillus amylolyticus]
MSIVRGLSILPVILLLLTLGCGEQSEEQEKEKPHVRGMITDFEEERGHSLTPSKIRRYISFHVERYDTPTHSNGRLLLISEWMKTI